MPTPRRCPDSPSPGRWRSSAARRPGWSTGRGSRHGQGSRCPRPSPLFWRWARHKFYVDEVYDFLVIRPFTALSNGLYKVVDARLIDTVAVGGTAGVAAQVGSWLRYTQTGNAQNYATVMAVAPAGLHRRRADLGAPMSTAHLPGSSAWSLPAAALGGAGGAAARRTRSGWCAPGPSLRCSSTSGSPSCSTCSSIRRARSSSSSSASRGSRDLGISYHVGVDGLAVLADAPHRVPRAAGGARQLELHREPGEGASTWRCCSSRPRCSGRSRRWTSSSSTSSSRRCWSRCT